MLLLPEFHTLATNATAILTQIFPNGIVVAKDVEGTIMSMFSCGTLERDEAGVVVRFEHLTYENHDRIHAKQEGFDWLSNAATPKREAQESWLPITAFPGSTQGAFHHSFEHELISSCMLGGH